jgi:tetratricopeptide (TPR) repeat protein
MVSRWSLIPELDQALKGAQESKNYARARAVCDDYCRNHPDTVDGYSARSILFSMMKNPAAALEDRDRAIRTRVGTPSAGDYSSRGKLLMQLGRWREAIEAWEIVSALDSTGWFEAYPVLMRAECYLSLGDLDTAEATCAEISDDYTFPGFRGLLAGSKFEILDDIATIRRGQHPR